MHTTATPIESAPRTEEPRVRFGTARRRLERKPPAAAPARPEEGDAWLIGLMTTLALTNLGVVWVVVNYVGGL